VLLQLYLRGIIAPVLIGVDRALHIAPTSTCLAMWLIFCFPQLILQSNLHFSYVPSISSSPPSPCSMEDANFDRSVANQAVTYLHNEEEWARQVLAENAAGEGTDDRHSFPSSHS
jgi:hypothetical protein